MCMVEGCGLGVPGRRVPSIVNMAPFLDHVGSFSTILAVFTLKFRIRGLSFQGAGLKVQVLGCRV